MMGEGIAGLLAAGLPFANRPALVLLVVITVGLLFGRIRLAGISLGPSAVIFSALAAGQLGYVVPSAMGSVGLVLFIYCVGLGAGPSFFRAFRKQGQVLALLGLCIVVVGAATTWLVSRLLGIPGPLSAGIFAGALTSTPGLAAAVEAMPGESAISVGFSLAYPFGLIGVVAFVHLFPRIIGADLGKLGRAAEAFDADSHRIERVLVKIRNPAVFGRKLSELSFIANYNCQVSRLLLDHKLVPVPADLVLEEGQSLLVIARRFRLAPVIQLLGEVDERTGMIAMTQDQSMHVVVSDRRIVGKTLYELNLRSQFGVTVTRIMRHDLEFVPRLADRIEYGDMLNVVGEHEHLERFAEYAGHRSHTFDETDLVSLGVGVGAGVALGVVEIGVGAQHMALGLTGGPLLVALILGHLGKIGPIKGHIPRASRLLLTDIGLVLLLADAGVGAGASLGGVLREYGVMMCLAAALVAILPMIVGAVVGLYLLRLPVLQLLGGICGGMTSTPGVGALTASTGSEAPVISYAAAYPVALVLMTVLVRMMLALLG
jgi:putative transport protein